MHTYFICDFHISQVEMREGIMKKHYVLSFRVGGKIVSRKLR